MSASSFMPVMGIVLQHKGGYTDESRDPVNWTGGKVNVGVLKGTKFGIAANSFPTLDIANLTRAQAVDIFRRKYATPIRFDALPDGVDYAVLDLAINSGVARAALILEQALAKLGRRLKVDGVLDDETLAALKGVLPTALIDAICDLRLSFMRKLKVWPTYKTSWTRRVGEVRQIAKGIVVTGRPLAFAAVEPAPSARGANAA